VRIPCVPPQATARLYRDFMPNVPTHQRLLADAEPASRVHGVQGMHDF
jgi:hypothetical protein